MNLGNVVIITILIIIANNWVKNTKFNNEFSMVAHMKGLLD